MFSYEKSIKTTTLRTNASKVQSPKTEDFEVTNNGEKNEPVGLFVGENSTKALLLAKLRFLELIRF